MNAGSKGWGPYLADLFERRVVDAADVCEADYEGHRIPLRDTPHFEEALPATRGQLSEISLDWACKDGEKGGEVSRRERELGRGQG